MLGPPVSPDQILGPIILNAPAFDENKVLIYRELYYDGFSSVTAARDLSTGTAVAIKKVEYTCMMDTHFPIRLLKRRVSRKVRNQASRLRSVSHNSVLKLVDFILEPIRMLIVTEMCMFGDLFNWMLQQPQIRLSDISLMFQYIFEALSYLHSQDFIHGSLSPTNILFQAMSPQSVTIMPDLSVRNELLAITNKTLPIMDCWAPEYLEAIGKIQSKIATTADLNIDPTNEDSTACHLAPLAKPMDIWSTACIMHIALTGKPPFSGEKLNDLLDDIKDRQTHEVEHPMLMTLSSKMRQQLMNCLQLDPEQRPPADKSFEAHWYEDDEVRADDRNILLIIEYDLISTCKRYRTKGRQMFESISTKVA